ncbi:hypothetical protein PVAND_005172 [Polypedilum vanderplanki]|uniref:UDENN domain-containing protein n=1 Tax=Polypedilum vanderplanki TaxID=319348 RepID=A0A9J6BZ48_POLVA|nr:hypothetical protein PVAND_005172 [Polypedilum vanderplanki]
MNRICSNANSLIELYCELELNKQDTQPKVTKIYPEDYKDDEILKIIGHFCFPCILPYRDEYFRSNPSQSFSFVLTNEMMKFGFCRYERSVESSVAKAIVILSFHPWHDVFLKFLNVLIDLRKKVHEKQFDSYLHMTLNKIIPREQTPINLTFSSNGIILQEFTFRRPPNRQLPSIPENHNLNLFYNYIEPKTMIEIFAALLAERRIIFVSQNLDKLSSCLQASCSLIQPMYWQHIYIPILPAKLKDYLLAPIPFCVGCHQSVFNSVRQEEIGEVVVVNCDTNIVINPYKDVTETLPQEIVNYLKKNLSNSPADLRGDRIPRIFLSSLVTLIGTYRDAISYQEHKMKFSNEVFIQSQSPQYKPFVEKVVHLQIFQQFIEERLNLIETNSELTDEFEIEVELQAAKMGRKSNQYKEFIRNIKGKANPVMKNAVKTVKATCKELKLKIKDKSDKTEFHLPNSNNSKDNICQNVFTQPAYTPSSSSSSTSSPASSSNMNILQEIEGILNASNSTNGSDSSKEKEDFNLIDFGDDNEESIPTNVPRNNLLDPFECVDNSDLLSDVIKELDKSTSIASRQNWTKFD